MSSLKRGPALDLVIQVNAMQARAARKLDMRLGSLHGIGFGDFVILRALRDAREVYRQLDLARQLHLSPSGLTRALIPLEKIHLIERERDARDARISRVRLTETGRRIVDDAEETAREACEQLFAGIPLRDLRAVAGLLDDAGSISERSSKASA